MGEVLMNQQERRIWLIDYLRNESPDLADVGIPGDASAQKDLLRALMNVRPPKAISDEFLQIQDTYLTAESEADGIVNINDLTHFGRDKRLYLWQGDITTLKCDAIVNAANPQMRGCFIPLHRCIDNCIHSKSGIQLRLKMDELMRRQGHDEPVGSAKISPAYNLPCEYVIHVAGPIVYDELEDEHIEQLTTCYRTCMEVADLYELTSIAFCCISTGEYHFPRDKAAQIATDTVRKYLDEHSSDIRVIFNVFSDEDLELYTHLL